jgi:hypothetical protein
VQSAQGRASERPVTLLVGVSDLPAKSIVYRMLKPVFGLQEEVRVTYGAEAIPLPSSGAAFAAHREPVIDRQGLCAQKVP